MIVLHAGAEEGRLLVWGEISRSVFTSRGGRKKSGLLRAHPGDAGPARLAEVLAEVVSGAKTDRREQETRILWLPTVKDQPIPSHPILGRLPETKTPPVVAPWKIAVLLPSTEKIMALLCACVGRDI